MAHTFSSLYTHIVFGTKRREPMIHNAQELHAYLGGIVRGLGGLSVKIGGVVDLQQCGFDCDDRYVFE